MKLPIKASAGIEEAPTAVPDVVARVAGVSLEWDVGRARGVWSLHMPLAVTDRRYSPSRTVPVLDATLIGGLVLALLAMVILRKEGTTK